jgi:hypothetical protein
VDIDGLNRAWASMAAAAAALDLSRHLTPTNLPAALDGSAAPRLEYGAAPEMGSLLDRAADDIPATEPWSTVFSAEWDALRLAHRALVTRSPADLTAYSVAAYGTPDPAVLSDARRYLDGAGPPGTEPVRVYSAADAAGIFTTVLRDAGLADWAVETPPRMVARMSVLGVKRTLRVRPDATFTAAELRRLIVHEIGTHAFRAANAARQALEPLSRGPVGYLTTEEGLAVWHEERAGLVAPDVMRRYALRYVACDAALRGGFREVVDELLPHTTPDEAVQIAMRVKRGLVDTSVPGGFLKDMAYFGGARAVAAHLAAHPGDHPLLMATKWPVTRVPLLRDLDRHGLLAAPRYHVDAAVALASKLVAE